jgi:hypothetical protein
MAVGRRAVRIQLRVNRLSMSTFMEVSVELVFSNESSSELWNTNRNFVPLLLNELQLVILIEVERNAAIEIEIVVLRLNFERIRKLFHGFRQNESNRSLLVDFVS